MDTVILLLRAYRFLPTNYDETVAISSVASDDLLFTNELSDYRCFVLHILVSVYQINSS